MRRFLLLPGMRSASCVNEMGSSSGKLGADELDGIVGVASDRLCPGHSDLRRSTIMSLPET